MRVKVEIMLSEGNMAEVLNIEVDEHTNWVDFTDLLRALLEAETLIKRLVEESAAENDA